MGRSDPDDEAADDGGTVFLPDAGVVSGSDASRTPTEAGLGDATCAIPSPGPGTKAVPVPPPTADVTCDLPAPADGGATCDLPAPDDGGATCDLPAPSPRNPQATLDLPPGGGAATGGTPSVVVRDSAAGTVGPAPAAPRRVGEVHIDGYVIEGELGRGGMGVVYKARQPKLRRTVAIKMIRAAGLASQEHVARFYAEARAVAALQHVNIVQIHDIGESDTLPYFSLEFVPGSSLDKKLAKQPQPPLEAAAMVETLARAMHYAHQHGIVHRDLKPANVLLSENGVPKITDFGLAKEVGEDSGMSRDGQAMGTPSYMPPEQARGDLAALGPLADVYSLGAILYEMLVGRPPFLGANPYDTLLQVLKKEPLAPSQLVPRLPKDIETICLKCLEKDPAKRYPSAADLAEDCRRYRAGEPILSRPISGPERAWRWCKRNPRVAGLLAAVAGLLVTVAVGSSVAAVVILAERDAKEVQRQAAVKAQAAAEEHERIAQENEKVAAAQAELALGTLQAFVDKVQTQLDEAPRTRRLKRELLDTAIAALDQVVDKAEKTTSIDATQLMAYVQYAEMYAKSGEIEEAIRRYGKCLEMAERRAAAEAAEHGEHDSSQCNVAVVASKLGELTMEFRRDPAAALEHYRQALAICERLAGQPRSAEGKVTGEQLAELLDETRTKIAALHYLQGDPAAALPLFATALDARRASVAAAPDDDNALLAVARSLHAMGEIRFLLGDRDAGFRLYEECAAVQEGLVARHPDVVPLEIDLAIIRGDHGELFLRVDDVDGARSRFDASVAIAERLHEQDPENAVASHTLALALYRRGQLAAREGDDARAGECFRRSVELRRSLAEIDPGNVSRRMELMLALARAGDTDGALAIAASLPTGRGDRELLLAVAKCHAIASRTTGDERAVTHVDRGIAALLEAVAAGFRDGTILRTDPDLAGLRDDPRYPVVDVPAVPLTAAP